jgi:hypothetical protein
MRWLVMSVVCAVSLTACGPVIVETGGPTYPVEYEYFRIPPGHLPPPGECRIWYPDLPPGHQPPPGDCFELEWEVPPGAWLIHGPAEPRDHFKVSVYDSQAPHVVVVIRYYEVGTGRLIRQEKAP